MKLQRTMLTLFESDAARRKAERAASHDWGDAAAKGRHLASRARTGDDDAHEPLVKHLLDTGDQEGARRHALAHGRRLAQSGDIPRATAVTAPLLRRERRAFMQAAEKAGSLDNNALRPGKYNRAAHEAALAESGKAGKSFWGAARKLAAKVGLPHHTLYTPTPETQNHQHAFWHDLPADAHPRDKQIEAMAQHFAPHLDSLQRNEGDERLLVRMHHRTGKPTQLRDAVNALHPSAKAQVHRYGPYETYVGWQGHPSTHEAHVRRYGR